MKLNWLKSKISSISLYKRFFEKRKVSPYERLVVICGMARTGTSALASYVGSHPDIKLVVGGGLWFNAESDLLTPTPDWETIDRLLAENSTKRILLKKPWVEGMPSLFERVNPKNVIVCFRDKDSLFRSWSYTEYVGLECKLRPDVIYDNALNACYDLVCKGALRISMENMEGRENVLGSFLNIDPAGFDPLRIQKRWRGTAEKEWLEKNAIWVERKR